MESIPLVVGLLLGTSTKLLHLFDVSCTPRGKIVCCFYIQSDSFLNAFCNACGGTHLSLASSLTCNEKVSLKHPNSIITFLNSLCTDCVSSKLAFLSASFSGPQTYYIFYLFMLITVGLPLELLFYRTYLLCFVH